jgi:PAS domain S-box-containing protein
MRQKSGSTFFAELSAKMLTNGHYQAIVRDITERKHVEKILQESEERYRLVSELTSDYAYKDRVEEDGNIVPEWFTESFTRITGYTLEETRVPGFWQRLVHPEDLPVLSEHMQNVLSGQPDTKEMRIFTKQGEVRWLKDYANPIWSPGHKRIVALYGAVQDVTEHKQAEENLRRFRLLSEHSRDIILFMGYQDGQILDANAAAVQAYGYSRDELLSLTIQDLRASDTLSQTVTQMTEAEANGILFETVHRRRDGSTFPVEVSSQGATIGGVRTLISIIRDITERKNAEKALTESEARFRSLFEQSADAILLLENGVFTDCNPATVEMMRAGSKQQMLSLHPSRLSPPSQPDGRPSAEKADEMIRIALERGSHRFEWIHRRLDGTDFPVEILLTSIATEDRQVIHTVWRDITERKQIELALQEAHDELERKVQERTAALSEANALLQALMDNMPDHIYFKDTKSRFIRNSQSQANLLGLRDPSEAVGKTDFDFFPHAAKSYAEEQEVMRSGRPLVDFEEWVLWPDGREMWVSTTKMPLRNSEGETIGIFGISRDITERKRSEQAIRQLNADLEKQAEQLQAANKELEAFSYSVSHDLRAPLRAIDGYTRILVEDYESILDDEGKRICGVISREAQRMGQLIDDLLAFSRLGRKEMYASRIDMKALAASVFDELLKEEKRENIDFNLRDLPMAQGDSSLIRQVWVNLLSNAIKFTSKKGRAIIEVGSQESTDEDIYYVRDNGAGFDMEYSNKLFGVFQRLHSESEFNGTGVGLAIVQRIIRRHDGRVWAEGEVEQGATFYFALPHKENLL